MTTLNVKIFVDVIALLSDEPLNKSIHMFDNGRMGSQAQGSHALVSNVLPGQLIRWTVDALDVQTQVWIKDIVFGPSPKIISSVEAPNKTIIDGPDVGANQSISDELCPGLQATSGPVPLWGKRFEGYVPFEVPPKLRHSYHFKLAFSEDNNRDIIIDGPALRVLPIPQVDQKGHNTAPHFI